MSDDDKFFTIVFRGNIRELPFNPLTADTIYGRPVSAGLGDALAERSAQTAPDAPESRSRDGTRDATADGERE